MKIFNNDIKELKTSIKNYELKIKEPISKISDMKGYKDLDNFSSVCGVIALFGAFVAGVFMFWFSEDKLVRMDLNMSRFALILLIVFIAIASSIVAFFILAAPPSIYESIYNKKALEKFNKINDEIYRYNEPFKEKRSELILKEEELNLKKNHFLNWYNNRSSDSYNEVKMILKKYDLICFQDVFLGNHKRVLNLFYTKRAGNIKEALQLIDQENRDGIRINEERKSREIYSNQLESAISKVNDRIDSVSNSIDEVSSSVSHVQNTMNNTINYTKEELDRLARDGIEVKIKNN